MRNSEDTGQTDKAIENGDALSPSQYRALEFDPAEFMQFVEDEDITEAEATELLQTIWAIVVAFVDLGFGIHPVQQAMDNSAKSDFKLPSDFGDVIASLHKVPNSNNTKQMARAGGQSVRQEES